MATLACSASRPTGGRRRARWWLLLAPLLVACAPVRHAVPVRPDHALDEPGMGRFRFVSSAASGFATNEGPPCSAIPRDVKDGLFGWQPAGRGPACFHDTLDQGLDPASLAIRWVAEIPRDGDYEVVQGPFGFGAWGKVTVRSSAWGEYFSSVTVAIEAETPSCYGLWTQLLAASEATGSGWVRIQAFEGAIEMGDLALVGCKAGEQVELKLRLLAESNRGSVSVDWFGFSAYTAADADNLFGLRARPPGKPLPVRDIGAPSKLIR